MFPPKSGHLQVLQIKKKRLRKTIQLLKIRCSIPDGINISFFIPEIMRLVLRPKQPAIQWLPEFTKSPRDWDVNLNTHLNLEGRLRISGATISLFSYIFSRRANGNMYLYLHFEKLYRTFQNYFSKFITQYMKYPRIQ